MGVSLSSEREAIAQYFEYQAEWRSEKAAEYPEDGRNANAAAGLRDLAAYVRSLSDDDDRVRELATLAVFDDVFSPGESASYTISRFCFNGPETPDRFLSDLVGLVVEDALKLAEQQ